MIDMIPQAHPRIILTQSRIEELQQLLKTDQNLQNLVAQLTVLGEYVCTQPPLVYRLDGIKRFRLLATSRQMLSRTMILGTLCRLDSQSKWRERLTTELKAVCAFKDWYPTHFLDTAEMATAVALGYDWLANDLSDVDRDEIRNGLIKHGLKAGVAPENPWWVTSRNNWNQVCHCGMVVTALALAHDMPSNAQALLESARQNFKTGMGAYAPDGVYPEGPSYWSYGTLFSVLMAAALQSTLKTDWGLLDMPGFIESFSYRMHVQGPTGRVVNYADSSEVASSSPPHFYLAQHLSTPGYASFGLTSMTPDSEAIERGGDGLDLKINRFFGMAVAWYTPEEQTVEVPLDWCGIGKGDVHVACMRSAWDTQEALFASLKGGALTVSHGHLDAGCFIIEADGERWASDLGMEYEIYDRDDAWGLQQDSHRWDFFRTGNCSHNTLTIDGQLQRVTGKAPIIATGAGTSPFVVCDLTEAYAGQAKQSKRGIILVDRKAVLIQDELEGIESGKEILWNMTTCAKIRLSKDMKTAVLKLHKKTMKIELSEPAEALFSILDATPPSPIENQNNGYQRLAIVLTSGAHPITIRVLFIPENSNMIMPEARALATWCNEPE